METMGCERDEEPVNSWPKSLYLMYSHCPLSPETDSLYKIDLPSPDLPISKTPTSLLEETPSLIFCPAEDRFAAEIKCIRLGSKVYFLGGQLKYCDTTPEEVFPRDVFVYDLADATPSLKKMSGQLNAGKPKPCMFSYKGKLYVLGTGPTMSMTLLSKIDCSQYIKLALGPMFGKLFECYDPDTEEWEVLEEPPLVQDPACWDGCIVLERHGLALVFGETSERHVTFLYDINRRKWRMLENSLLQQRILTSPSRERYLYHLFDSPSCVAGSGDDEYVLYGLSSSDWLPIKMNLKVIRESDGESFNITNQGSVSTVTVVNKTERYRSKKAVFDDPYYIPRTQLLSLGDGYLCFVVAGNLDRPDSPDRYGCRVIDPC